MWGGRLARNGPLRKGSMGADGVRTVATIERVTVTVIGVGEARADGRQADNQVVYLALRFSDKQGTVVVHERRSDLRPEKIPAPGWSVCRLRGRQARDCRLRPTGHEAAGPECPTRVGCRHLRGRGPRYASGEVTDRQARHRRAARSFFDRPAREGRGRRLDAPVYRLGQRLKRGAAEVTLKLRVEGSSVETKAWVPAACVPEPGDLIEIAMSADRWKWRSIPTSDTTDPPVRRSSSPPARARRQRPPLSPIDVEANRPWTAERAQEFAAANAARVEAMPQGPANLQVTLAESAKQALASTTDPAQRQVIIQQYRAMGIELDEDE